MRRGQVEVLLRCSIRLTLDGSVEAMPDLLVRAGALVHMHTLERRVNAEFLVVLPSLKIKSFTLEEKYRSFSFAFLTRLTAAYDLRSLSDCFVLFSIGGGE